MAARDLTILQNVKDYIGNMTTADATRDALLARLITTMSVAFVQEIGFEVLRKTYSETMDGDDERIRKRVVWSAWIGLGFGFEINLHGPVIGDPVVTIDGAVVPKRATLDGSGWVLLDGYRLEIVDFQLTNKTGNVTLAYEGGQYVGSPQDPLEAATIPANPGPYTITAAQALGRFVSDVKIAKASDGTAFTKVASGPAAGQYSVDALGVYTFAAADQGTAVLLSYAYLPADVEQCVIEMVTHIWNKRPRLDQVSANMGGQSVFFSREAWPITVQHVIDRWERPIV